MSQSNPSADQLKRAVAVAEQIEKLQAELTGILTQTGSVAPAAPAAPVEAAPEEAAPKRRGRPPGKAGKRVMSVEARAKIADAQRRRWAKSNGGEAPAAAEAPAKAPSKKKKGSISPEGRERIAAAQRARWAKANKDKA